MNNILESDIALLYNFCITKNWPQNEGNTLDMNLTDLYRKENAKHKITFCSEDVKCKVYSFYIIRNNDGHLRWLIPVESKEPRFLKFYAANKLKSKLYSAYTKLYYKLNLQDKMQREVMQIRLPLENKLTHLLEELNAKDFSVFLGTKGEGRKIVMEVENEQNANFFVKIPVTKYAVKLIGREAIFLAKAKGNSETIFPKLIPSKFQYVIQENMVANVSHKRINTFDKTCEKFIAYNLNNQLKSQELEMSSFYQDSIKKLEALEQMDVKPVLKNCYQSLKKFSAQLDLKGNCKFHLAHGDFTPWNIYKTEEQLYIYDWEMYMDFAPLYYDFFHFFFQQGILQDRKSFQEIYLQLREEIVKLKDYNFKEVFNWKKYLTLYLWHLSCHYISMYQVQEDLHEQVAWLVDTWEEGLNWSLNLKNQNIDRKNFAANFFSYLNDSFVQYVWLKSCKKSIFELKDGSDVDVLIRKNDLKFIEDYLNMHPAVLNIKSLKQSFMHTFEVFLNNGEMLHFDFIHKFKRRNKVYLNSEKVFAHKKTNTEGIYISAPEDDYEYCLNFYQLNGSGVPNHYLKYFEECGLKFPEIEEHSKYLKNSLESELEDMKENKSFSFISNSVQYGLDKIRLLKDKRGFIVSFSGVDGAGKSTVISKIKQVLEEKYRKEVVVLRHRPSLLPILSSFKYGKEKAEQKAASKLPRQGNNQSKINSTFRFLYYFSDYFVGQFIVYSKYILRGKIVLYDRYYFDFINDPKRTNLNLTESLPLAFSKFVIKPDINFLLTAPANEILKRKQELTAEDIDFLNSKYKNYFGNLENRNFGSFKTIENIDLDETLLTIENEIKTSYIN